MGRWSIVMLFAIGCSGKQDSGKQDTEEEQTGCGDVTTFDVTVKAAVTRNGRVASGIAVRLEERNWEPGTLGEGTTGADGTVSFLASPVTSIDRCWATALDYWIVADDAGNEVEDDMNTELYNAISDGSLVADVTGRPLEF